MSLAEARGAITAQDTVLVVDGEVLVRLALAAYLRDCGYRVFEAAGAGEAVLILEDASKVVHVVLTAVELGGEMSGFELARWIRRRRPGLQVMLAGTIARAAEAAGNICEQGPTLARPYDPQVVVDRIRRLRAGRSRD